MKNKKNGIQIKDLISIGIYTALYFLLVGISAMITILILPGYSYVFIPVISALLAGTVFMLMVAKVPRFGAITIMGSIMGIFFFVMGRFPASLFISVLFGLIADGIAYLVKYKSKKGLLGSYLVFSFNPIGPVVPLFLFPTLYADRLSAAGKDANYIAAAFSDITNLTFWFLLAAIFVAALVGGVFGQRMMEKHFKKAGIV